MAAEVCAAEAAAAAAADPSAMRNVFTTVPETPQTELGVEGALPPWLEGRLWRNGPGQFEVSHADGGVTPMRHWFDGVSMLHRFEVGAGVVRYGSTITAKGLVRAAAGVKKRDYVKGNGVGLQDPCKGLYGRAMALWRGVSKDPEGKGSSNVGVTVESVPGLGLLSRSDVTTNYRIDEDALEAMEFSSWAAVEIVDGAGKGGGLVGEMSAAHGEFDAGTEEYFNFVYKLGVAATASYKVFAISGAGEARTVAEFAHRPTYVHSLALTDRYVIMVIHPVHVGLARLLYYASLGAAVSFDENTDAVFYVMLRDGGGVVARYAAPAFFQFHTVNAWDDEDGDVHVDLCRYDDASILQQLYTENLRTKPGSFFSGAKLHRFTLPGVGSAAAEHEEADRGPSAADAASAPLREATVRQLCGESLELPRINPAFARRPHRYVYGPGPGFSSGAASGAPFSRILKIDVETGESAEWSQPHLNCSEAIFVADPEGEVEDDGVLLSVCHDAVQTRSFMLVLDARNLAELARAYTPNTVPAGFHGAWKP